MLITEYNNLKVADYLRMESPAKVCLIFWHGLGDLVMFIPTYYKLKIMFPETKIDIALQEGTGQKALMPGAIEISDPGVPIDGYDYTFQIHYPMSEHDNVKWTKNEWCCMVELGIDPIDEYPKIKKSASPFVACHFQATALPDPINPTEEVAEKIWNEILDTGLIPIEVFFRHKYYNPVNEKFKFIDCTVRRAKPSIKTLVNTYNHCFASICVASGNLPVSISIMPTRTLYLKKAYDIECYTRKTIPQIDVTNYEDGKVKEWLVKLS